MIPFVSIFSEMDNFEFFGLNLGKLLDYVRYFGSNNVKKSGRRLKYVG